MAVFSSPSKKASEVELLADFDPLSERRGGGGGSAVDSSRLLAIMDSQNATQAQLESALKVRPLAQSHCVAR